MSFTNGRSFAKELGKGVFEAYSAGTEDYPEVKPGAVQVMEEVGIDMSSHKPKLLEDIPSIDILITMGCGVECPYLPCSHREDWGGLEDPSGGPIEGFRNTRDIIKSKVLELKERIESDKL